MLRGENQGILSPSDVKKEPLRRAAGDLIARGEIRAQAVEIVSWEKEKGPFLPSPLEKGEPKRSATALEASKGGMGGFKLLY